MVGKPKEIVDEYEKCLQEMPFIPLGSYRRRMVRQDGGPNRDFLACLFCDNGLAMQFLKDVGLLRSKVQCNTCDRDMTWSVEPSIPEGFRWSCQRKVPEVKCSASKSIRTGSCFLHGYNAVSAPHYIRDGRHLVSRFLKSDHVPCDFSVFLHYALATLSMASGRHFCTGR